MNKRPRPIFAVLTNRGQAYGSPLKLTLAVAAVLTLSTGCAAAETDGPLSAGGDESEICTPALQEGFAAVGDVVVNESDQELTITNVELVDPTDLTLEESYLMVIEGAADEAVLGTASTVSDDPQEMAAWERRTKVENFTLGPGETANVIVALSLPNSGTDGKAEAMRIAYSDGSSEFTADTDMKITLASEESCS